jgi:hypothetical protein
MFLCYRSGAIWQEPQSAMKVSKPQYVVDFTGLNKKCAPALPRSGQYVDGKALQR